MPGELLEQLTVKKCDLCFLTPSWGRVLFNEYVIYRGNKLYKPKNEMIKLRRKNKKVLYKQSSMQSILNFKPQKFFYY